MDCNLNMLYWQKVFRSIKNTNINDYGEGLSEIIDVLKKAFEEKNYHTEDGINNKYKKDIENILKMFLINTKFKIDHLNNMDEFVHLQGFLPSLSKYVMAQIITQLDCAEIFGSIALSLPLPLVIELLNELVNCVLLYGKPKKQLMDLVVYLTTIINFFTHLEDSVYNDNVSQITAIFIEILSKLNETNVESVRKMKTEEINVHIGDIIYNIFVIIKKCSPENPRFHKLLDLLIQNCMTMVKLVTMDVYCTWAEVQHRNGQRLQSIICNEAYYVMEHLEHYEEAKALISILKSMAQKPKPVKEIIREADIEITVQNINYCDEHQQLWYNALICKQGVFSNNAAVDCILKWSQLCSSETFLELLKMCSKPNVENKLKLQLISTLSEHLNEEDVKFALVNYYKHNNFTVQSNVEDIAETLTSMLKKMSDNALDDNSKCCEIYKTFYISFWQNPEYTTKTIFNRCLRKAIYVENTKPLFKSLTDFPFIDCFLAKNLEKCAQDQPFSRKNMECYKELLNTLIEFSLCEEKALTQFFFAPLLHYFYDSEQFETLLITLEIINKISFNFNTDEHIVPIIEAIIKLIDNVRCNLLSFSNVKMGIVEEGVTILEKYIRNFQPNNCVFLNEKLSSLKTTNNLSKYYCKAFFPEQIYFLSYIYTPKTRYEIFTTTVALMKHLPSLTTSEWKLIAEELQTHLDCKSVINIFTSSINYLCLHHSLNKEINEACMYCLKNYKILIKEHFKNCQDLQIEEALSNSIVCNLLPQFEEEWLFEGLQLVELLSKDSLRALKNDKKFVVQLLTFKCFKLSKQVSGIMLS